MNGDVQKAEGDDEGADAEIARQREVFARPFASLIADGRRRTAGVERALDEIALRSRGRIEDRSYRHFADVLRLVNKAVRRRLDRAEATFERLPEPAYDTARVLMKAFAGRVEKQVEALRKPRDEALEVFAQPFSRMTKAFLDNADLLFFGWALEGYELRVFDDSSTQDLGSEAAQHVEALVGPKFQFLQFWHPALRQPDLFQHAVFGHELGHAAIQRTPPQHVLTALGITSREPTFANVATDTADARRRASRVPAFEKEDRQKLGRWFAELACDMIGTRLLGPAFVLAFVEVTSVNHDFERHDHPHYKNYPPWRMRREFLARGLQAFHFGRLEERLRPLLDDALECMLGPDDPDEEIAGATAWMTDAFDAFTRHCLPALLAGEELDADALRDDLPAMWALLDADIPPAEKITVTHAELSGDGSLTPWSREYNWRRVLNGVRLWLLARLAEAPERDPLKERETALRLATGAIEIAEFHRRARVLSTQFDGMRLPESWR